MHMIGDESIFLVGPMGAGKSTVGRLLSSMLGREFIDSDAEIVRRAGMDIPGLFAQRGEEGFRELEAEILADLTSRRGLVLATGGGAVKRPENRQCLRNRGRSFYLLATPEAQFARTRGDSQRPLLRNDDPLGTLRRLFAERDPLYREAAGDVVDTSGLSPRQVAESIVGLLTVRKES